MTLYYYTPSPQNESVRFSTPFKLRVRLGKNELYPCNLKLVTNLKHVSLQILRGAQRLSKFRKKVIGMQEPSPVPVSLKNQAPDEPRDHPLNLRHSAPPAQVRSCSTPSLE